MSHVKSALSQDSAKDLIRINDTDQIEDFNARGTEHSWQDEVQKVNQNHGTPPKYLTTIYTVLNGQQSLLQQWLDVTRSCHPLICDVITELLLHSCSHLIIKHFLTKELKHLNSQSRAADTRVH